MSIRRDPDAPRPLAFSLDRRAMLVGTGATLATVALPRQAGAQVERIVVADPGGPFGVAFKAAFHDTVQKDLGFATAQIAREHEPTAQVAGIVKTKNFTWDCVTLTLSARPP